MSCDVGVAVSRVGSEVYKFVVVCQSGRYGEVQGNCLAEKRRPSSNEDWSKAFLTSNVHQPVSETRTSDSR